MAFCLTLQAKTKFKEALKSGAIDPKSLGEMGSLKRREFLAKYVGAENAKQVNTLFERKQLFKNLDRGYISWAESVSGAKTEQRKSYLEKIEKNRIERERRIFDPKKEEKFLRELASASLKLDVTRGEAKNIAELSKKIEDTKVVWQKELDSKPEWSENPVKTRKEWMGNANRIKHGYAIKARSKYMNKLKSEAGKISYKEKPLQAPVDVIKATPAVIRSGLTTLDNSLWGRQGIKTLLDVKTSHIWVRHFLQSWVDIGKQLKAKGKFYKPGDDAVMDLIEADILSRPNAMNGKYKAGDYGLNVEFEEDIPSTLLEYIPVLGRPVKAANVAYSGGALRLRADLADRAIYTAEQNGINMLKKDEAAGIGQMVSSLTGRGPSLGQTAKQQKITNLFLFSFKFATANIDTLFAPATYATKKVGQKAGLYDFKTKGAEFAAKESAKTSLRIIAGIASILAVAKMIDPDSIDEDPRSTNFGKIKIFGLWTDITGGMGGYARLAARLIPTKHNGKWGMWRKSGAGNWVNLRAGEYAQDDWVDSIVDGLFLNKLSPIASDLKMIVDGETWDGDSLTLKSFALAHLPISVQNAQDLKDNPNAEYIIGSLTLEGLGLSISTYYYKANWNEKTSKEMLQFKSKIGQAKFNEANDVFNKKYSDWFKKMDQNKEYNSLSSDSKADLVTKAKKEIKQQVFKQYRFKYKTTKPTSDDKREDKKIDKLLP